MKAEAQKPAPREFTIGICASGPEWDVPKLARSILHESDALRLHLSRVIIVASECPESVTSELRALETRDSRVQALIEDVRHGKADAVNKILARARGGFVVMVNADAKPEPQAIPRLLSVAQADNRVGAVSAMPVIEAKRGLSSLLVDLIWSTYNASSRLLNHMGIANHASEELVAFRLSAIGMLPKDLVNDGAFLASVVRRRGYAVRFCDSARVRIETPRRVPDLIAQRRRIMFGHAQVWRKAGTPPKTIESLLLFSPSIGLRVFVKVIARSPRFLLILPVAFATEISAALLSILDSIRSTRKHAVWRRFT